MLLQAVWTSNKNVAVVTETGQVMFLKGLVSTILLIMVIKAQK